MICLVVSDDLMFTQLISNALPPGGSIRPSGNVDALEKQLDDSVETIVVDLSTSTDPNRFSELASRASTRLIGVASHVHVARIRSAKEAGFDFVLTRSQVAEQLPQILEQ